MISDIGEECSGISIGIKQCVQDTWDGFAENCKKGDKISGVIKSITDFGIFIGLEGNIDGLVHLSDISWDEAGEDAVRKYKKGDEIETVILSIDPERERISLGVKQLANDPFMNYVADFEKGSIVTGSVTAVDAKAATITLAEGVEGVLRASEISRDKVEDARNVLQEGAEIEIKIVSVDRKNRVLKLAVKAIEVDDERAAIHDHKKQDAAEVSHGTIGDLIKAEMNKN